MAHNSASACCGLSAAVRKRGQGLFLVPLLLILRNSLRRGRRRCRLLFRRGGCSQFRRSRAVTGPELSALYRSDELAAHRRARLYLNNRLTTNGWSLRRDGPL